MEKRKILITGGSGLLGSNLSKVSVMNGWDTYFTFNRHPVNISKCKGIKVDLTDYKETREMISKINPNAIIHCAALTNVDYCEDNYDESVLVNAGITGNLAKISNDKNIKFVYISTDSIFDGIKGNYKEEDAPNPLNSYAKTKLLGEQATQNRCNDYLIIRTNIYGWDILNKLSLAEFIISKLEKNEPIQGFKDVYFTPIFVNNLSDIILEMCDKDAREVFNVAGSQKCSKLDFAKMVAGVFGFKNPKIKPVSADASVLKAKRPKDTSLDTSKLKKLCLESKLLGVREGLEYMKNLREKGYVKGLKEGCNYSGVQ